MAVESIEVDVAVVGAGTAGLAARRAAVRAGVRVLLINAGPWGTTCVRAGCMPSKLLLVAARAARDTRRAGTFGIEAGPVRINGRAVMARVQSERDHFLRSILEELNAIPAAEKIDGLARFVGPTTLKVADGVKVLAKSVVIATGATPSIPKLLAPLKARVLTSDTVFDLEDLPFSLAVVGAGPLGLELAAAFTRLGVRTTVFDERDSLGGLKDAQVGKAARALLGAELDLKLRVKIEAQPDPDGSKIRWTGADGAGEAMFDRVLVAAGRPPDLKHLDLQAAALDLDERGIPLHDPTTLRCGDSAVFIAGDAANDLPVLHVASRQGEVAGRNAATLPVVQSCTPQSALSIVFTDPDIAVIGQPLKSLGEDAAIGRCDFDAGRGRIEHRPGGMISIYAHRKDGIIAGGEMVGAGVEHLAHTMAIMVQQRITVKAALELPFYHPTFEEVLKNCLRELLHQLDGSA